MTFVACWTDITKNNNNLHTTRAVHDKKKKSPRTLCRKPQGRNSWCWKDPDSSTFADTRSPYAALTDLPFFSLSPLMLTVSPISFLCSILIFNETKARGYPSSDWEWYKPRDSLAKFADVVSWLDSAIKYYIFILRMNILTQNCPSIGTSNHIYNFIVQMLRQCSFKKFMLGSQLVWNSL